MVGRDAVESWASLWRRHCLGDECCAVERSGVSSKVVFMASMLEFSSSFSPSMNVGMIPTLTGVFLDDLRVLD